MDKIKLQLFGMELILLFIGIILLNSSVLAAAPGDLNFDKQVNVKDLSTLNKCLSYLELRVNDDGTLRKEFSRYEASQIVGIRSFGKDCISRKHLDINMDKKNDKNDYWLLKSCLDFRALLDKGYTEDDLSPLLKVDYKAHCQPLISE